jgi:hypothetical protein
VVISTNNTDWPALEPLTDVSGMPNVFHVWPGMAQQDAVDYPTLKSIDISDVAGGQPTVWVRFHWTGTWGYSWFVDDVALLPLPANVNNIGVFPNPTTGLINIRLQLEKPSYLTIDVIDVRGSVVFTKAEYSASGNSKLNVDLTDLQAGIYSVRVRPDQGNQMLKQVVKTTE